jgi:hypothetical protein
MYAKVFSQMYDGSLCTHGPWEALVTFQQLLVLADQEGTVDMTAEAIARRTTIPLNIIKLGIEELLKPDSKSRTPVEEGRRIIPLSGDRDWGWLVVNYKHYRQLKREEDRREYHREYWHKRKNQQTQHAQPNQPIAEAKAEADTEEKQKIAATPLPARSPKAPKPAPVSFSGLNADDIAPKAVTVLSADFELPVMWGTDALALGWTRGGILQEAERFRQYWVSGKGSGSRKSMRGWRQSWSNWLSKAEKMNGAAK